MKEREGNLKRGRAYLEKIVQYQIGLPITLPEELTKLLFAELSILEERQMIPKNWQNDERFQEIWNEVNQEIISTPRDIRRLVGIFHVLSSMVKREVDWVDLLGFSILSEKAPMTVEQLRKNPEIAVEDPLSARASIQRMSLDKKDTDERIKNFVPDDEYSNTIVVLLGKLFPYFASDQLKAQPATDAIRYRRPLLTVLRLGILPGMFSRDDIQEFCKLDRFSMCARMEEWFEEDKIKNFIDRLDDVYGEIDISSHDTFWISVSDFLRKSDDQWIQQYSFKAEISRAFASVFERQVRSGSMDRKTAEHIIRGLFDKKDVSLVAYFARTLIFAHGLFNMPKKKADIAVLEPREAEELVKSLSRYWRDQHVRGERWLATLWDLQPVYTMMEASGNCAGAGAGGVIR